MRKICFCQSSSLVCRRLSLLYIHRFSVSERWSQDSSLRNPTILTLNGYNHEDSDVLNQSVSRFGQITFANTYLCGLSLAPFLYLVFCAFTYLCE